MNTRILAWLSAYVAVAAVMASVALQAGAHFVWIEVPGSMAPGKEQSVKLYFGEYHEFLREEAGGRLDERAGLSAWLVGPTGKKNPVALEKRDNFFQAKVKPEKCGRYNILATDLVTPVQDGTKYPSIGILYKPMFYARTQFLAFEEGRVSEHESDWGELLDLDIVPLTSHLDPLKGTISPKAGDEVVLQVTFKGQPLEKAAPLTLAPNGWQKDLRTNAKGIARFTPIWPGTYVIDCVHLERKPGEYEGKKYEGVRHRATFTIQVRGREEQPR